MNFYFTRQILSWALYDFANSAFATTILSVIFNVYFVKVICGNGVLIGNTVIPGESFWSYVIAGSMLIVFFLSPILGAIADFSAWKKKFLILFAILGFIFTGLLYFCGEGDYWLAGFLFLIANVGFAGGNVFYNALLHDVSTPETYGRISGFGWAVGYIGGGLLLVLNLLMVQKPHWFLLTQENYLPVRMTFFSVGLWWAFFSLPIFMWVNEKKSETGSREARKPASCFSWLSLGFREVISTLKQIRQNKEIFKYLIAYLIYNDGIETVILMASIFGAKELGMSQNDLILCFLMIQAVAFLGALFFGNLADRIGHKRSISLTLWIYLGVCIWGTVMQTRMEFWILGAIVGLILGGSQAASRSLLAMIVPSEKSGQYFGFFGLTGKLSTVMGPLVFGLVSQFFSLRAATGSLAVFFLAGLILLSFVHGKSQNL